MEHYKKVYPDLPEKSDNLDLPENSDNFSLAKVLRGSCKTLKRSSPLS